MDLNQKVKQTYKQHKGVRSKVVAALIEELGVTPATANTYYKAVAWQAHQEKALRRARWSFLSEPHFWIKVALMLSLVPQFVKLLTLLWLQV